MNAQNKSGILVVDDDAGHRTTLKTVLKSWKYDISEADDGQTAVNLVTEAPFDLILMDVRMAVMNGIDALIKIKSYNPAIPIIIMTAYSSVESAVEAMKAGAYDYLTKPLDFDELKLTIERALEHTRLRDENKSLKAQLQTLAETRQIVATSPEMKSLLEMVATIAPSEATVLITGASGTGKELIARAIHANSSRSKGQLVTVNCAALTETLLESELFGHEKGAFTGADRRREGRFVQADRGTLFLDEVGEMSMSMQAKLLRVLQEGEIQRVGGDKPIAVDVRIIAATNKELSQMVENGKFREDLFYRLNVVNIHVPPLSERTDDIPALAQHFVNLYAERNRKKIKGFTPQAMDSLLKYAWPGNVRELENMVERAVILSPGEYITEKDLPLNISNPETQTPQKSGPLGISSNDAAESSLDKIERSAIVSALDRADGNKSEAARMLGITRRTLYNKLEKYGIE
ncbi:MAG: sigma-54 dependent transcriptional regulator [Desulfobacteraceae bacterium]|nr:sigma-54 dependent transcriptional regulator [Desulfobacteraceae bacterium]MCF8095020.1 sigma-54 dependent transcriptional regulator [Desulfobacteraceae bacterium]